jgi:hypothetical protein
MGRKINNHRAIMADRKHPKRSLDFFVTPPWATRALFEHVITPYWQDYHAWEPACGQGHMAEVMREYFGEVYASDIHDYGYGERRDFLKPKPWAFDHSFDWIITNPPFGEKTEQFVLRAIGLTRVGVAIFTRLQWLETTGRYERIFKPFPPTRVCFFAERVNLRKGRWDPDGATATAYVWLVWLKGIAPQPPLWIPPGCRTRLTRPDDRMRFEKPPVKPRLQPPAAAP